MVYAQNPLRFCRYVKEFVHGNMFRVVDSFWFSVCKFVFYVLGSIIRFIFRIHACENFERDETKSSGVVCEEENDNGWSSPGTSELDGFSTEETRFQFKNSDHVDTTNGEGENSVLVESVPIASASKYEFFSGKDISGFVEEPITFRFVVHDLFMGSDDHGISHGGFFETAASVENDIQEPEMEEKSFFEEKAEDSVESFMVEGIMEKEEQQAEPEGGIVEKADNSADCLSIEKKLVEQDQETLSSSVKAETISPTSCERFDLITYEFMASGDAPEEFVPQGLAVINGENEEDIEEIPLFDMVVKSSQTIDSDDEFIELDTQLENSSFVAEEMSTMESPREVDDEYEQQDLIDEETIEPLASLEELEEPSSQKEQFVSDFEEEDDPDYTEEHDDLIERLKMELRIARTGGLPTIHEEEQEYQKLVEELKPLKIDEKFKHKDRITEIHKVYRSYCDRMRKLDISSSQTIHAISLLKLKDSAQSDSTEKSSGPAKSHGLRILWPFRLRRPEADPVQRLIGDLHKDFETVYVGQACLSWEILRWQFTKALELLHYDCQAVHQYNQVAGDFQLFQVLVQRFIENEPFQGRQRVENYMRNRRGFQKLMQVPVIRADSSGDNKRRSGEEEDVITISVLTEIIWESMCAFWEFLRADKCEARPILQVPHQTQVAPQGPLDLDLLTEIQADLQKKERRLKDIIRSGNCITKKFQKQQLSRLSDTVLIARVELKLISRVLSLSKLTTDQLAWCREKLQKIRISSRKIHLEPSFSLFPC